MPAVIVLTVPTVTQNSPFLLQRWRPRPPPALIAPTHKGMARVSGTEWPGECRDGIDPPEVHGHQSQY